jgi:hypothetical protein
LIKSFAFFRYDSHAQIRVFWSGRSARVHGDGNFADLFR